MLPERADRHGEQSLAEPHAGLPIVQHHAAGELLADGRLLASNCSQCHGTLGTSGFGEIRGSDSSELTEFATKTANGNIMAAHAQGYTPEQLQAIAAYLRQ